MQSTAITLPYTSVVSGHLNNHPEESLGPCAGCTAAIDTLLLQTPIFPQA
jgi:hypothetical protein